jgi:hypothetical protein
MGTQQDIEEAISRRHVTKIDGQPQDEDVSKLLRELTEIAASFPTSNGGGSHGHIGMLMDNAEYQTISTGGQPFVVPTNPGAYPVHVDPNDAVVRERQIADHKLERKEFETYLGVASGLRTKIQEAVDEEWLEGIRHEQLGFTHLTPMQLMDHISQGGALLDYMDVGEITAKLMEPWDGTENPATRFGRDDKYERQLIKAGLPDQQALRLALAQGFARKSGEYDAFLREFDARPVVDRTFPNFRPGFITEYAKRSKHKDSARSAGFGIANSAFTQPQEETEAMLALATIAQVLQEGQQKQMQELMAQFTAALKDLPGSKAPAPAPASQPKAARVQTYPTCPHCQKRHLKPELCWELDTNAALRPANWKPVAERAKRST